MPAPRKRHRLSAATLRGVAEGSLPLTDDLREAIAAVIGEPEYAYGFDRETRDLHDERLRIGAAEILIDRERRKKSPQRAEVRTDVDTDVDTEIGWHPSSSGRSVGAMPATQSASKDIAPTLDDLDLGVLGDRIRHARTMKPGNPGGKTARTQLSMAVAIGVALSTYSSWERGEHRLPRRDLEAIEKITGYSHDYFLGLADE